MPYNSIDLSEMNFGKPLDAWDCSIPREENEQFVLG